MSQLSVQPAQVAESCIACPPSLLDAAMHSLRMLTRYKAWADARLLSTLVSLSAEQLSAPQPIVFGSLIRTLNHVRAMDQVWRCHLLGEAHGLHSRNPEFCPPLDALMREQNALNGWFVDYADALSAPAWNAQVDFEFIGGGAGRLSRAEILLHVVNHASYHRGHMADMLYRMQVQPPTTDLPVFLNEVNGATGASWRHESVEMNRRAGSRETPG